MTLNLSVLIFWPLLTSDSDIKWSPPLYSLPCVQLVKRQNHRTPGPLVLARPAKKPGSPAGQSSFGPWTWLAVVISGTRAVTGLGPIGPY
ncbi:hypothetical protein PoB_002690300 [Plakobranchus ocellatus]|uniref:Secreted protein n=1 Tax=Plakobranchus ocellatus TaxID=259542 RepID=A0AAV3ZZT0_9GAST|nr:hypothetical protein PoB_002690300 [Plakobranchus ocellatus]